MTLAKRCQPIELILADVDGVMTDGGIVFTNDGIEAKRFHIRDGAGVKFWQRSGGTFGIITGRNSHIVNVRAAELGIEIVRQGVQDKLSAAREIVAELGLSPPQVCYIGDDLPDLPVLGFVGLGVAVADAATELVRTAAYVTTLSGGQGAVRETIEMILKNQHRWDELIEKFSA